MQAQIHFSNQYRGTSTQTSCRIIDNKAVVSSEDVIKARKQLESRPVNPDSARQSLESDPSKVGLINESSAHICAPDSHKYPNTTLTYYGSANHISRDGSVWYQVNW